MKLNHKKELAAKVLGVGKKRIIFVQDSLSEVKEAITRQDILDLHKAGAIQIKEKKGRKKVIVRKHRRGVGKVKQKIINTKRNYIELTRKLRSVAKRLLFSKEISKENYQSLRKMIKASKFKSRRHLLEHIKEIKENKKIK